MISTELKKLVDHKNECCCEYHLAHKCKEWASNLKFNIVTLNTLSDFKRWKCAVLQKTGERYPINCRNGYVYEGDVQNIVISGFSQITENYFADTEPEAIFKACEYILKELSN